MMSLVLMWMSELIINEDGRKDNKNNKRKDDEFNDETNPQKM